MAANDHDHIPNIPAIALTTDFASTHSLHSSDGEGKPPQSSVLSNETEKQSLSPESDYFPLTPLTPGLHHARSPSDPAFLSPYSMSPTSATGGGRSSLDVPPRSSSPSYASSHEGSSMTAPPSPTLSTQSSVHFAPTTLALRDNKPGDGVTSLNLLPPDRHKHHRKTSFVTGSRHSSINGTESNLGPSGHSVLQRVASMTTSITAVSPPIPRQNTPDHFPLRSCINRIRQRVCWIRRV